MCRVNAGVLGNSTVLDIDMAALRQMFEVNTFAPLAMTQAFAPLLVVGAEKSGKKSVILNVGSVSALGIPWFGGYGASKAAMMTLSDTLRRETVNLGITTITADLSLFKTPMTTGSKPFNLTSTPPCGLYTNVDAAYAANAKAITSGVDGAESVFVIANRLATAIVAQNPPPRLWGGSASTLIKWLVTFLPGRMMDMFWVYASYTKELKPATA